MIAYGSDVPFKLAAMRFLAANSSTWNIGKTQVNYEFLPLLQLQQQLSQCNPISGSGEVGVYALANYRIIDTRPDNTKISQFLIDGNWNEEMIRQHVSLPLPW